MVIEQAFTVNAPRDDVAKFLSDVNELRSCIPGLERVEEIDVNHYRGALTLHVGPIKTHFQGAVVLDSSQAPSRLSASGTGLDKASGTIVQVKFTADLVEDADASTVVNAVADVVLRGKLAKFGSGVIKATAVEIVRDFSKEVNARLSGPQEETATGHTAAQAFPPLAPVVPLTTRERAPRALNARLMLGILARSFWVPLKRRFRQMTSVGRPRGDR